MTFTYEGREYKSKKHPMLEFIFNKYNPNRDTTLKQISFTLADIAEGYAACGIFEPASISNTILDLTRKERPIESRVPSSIYSLGYDLRKKTGVTPDGQKYAGEFVFVGVGNQIQSWLIWPATFDVEMTIFSVGIPAKIRSLLRNDEGALFSVIDYCDVFSVALYNLPKSVLRIQNPIKWQPNEIDGYYFSDISDVNTVFIIEAKSLATQDDINLEQMQGALNVASERLASLSINIIPLGVRMIDNGIQIALFNRCVAGAADNTLELDRFIKVYFYPEIPSWSKRLLF
jgi:hypothetical protein